MFDRKVLKEKGKAAFKANYWRTVLVSLILSALTGATTVASGSSTANSASDAAGAQDITELVQKIKENPQVFAVVIGAIIFFILTMMLIEGVIDAFLINPVELGCKSFFLKNADDPNTPIDEIKSGFTPYYMRNVKALFLRDFFVALWALLLIVPGIMKSYSYKLVPYLLAEDPDLAPKAALEKSETMMKGHRWELFVLELSFIGWDLLTILTLGILDVFYVGPYTRATRVEFYKALKETF